MRVSSDQSIIVDEARASSRRSASDSSASHDDGNSLEDKNGIEFYRFGSSISSHQHLSHLSPISPSHNQQQFPALNEKAVGSYLSMPSCLFCASNKNPIRFLHQSMHDRYFDAFNFYFAKPINEILNNERIPHVILIRDLVYLSESNEYLKRYYELEEVPPRLNVLTHFFTHAFKPCNPNLLPVHVHRILAKNKIRHSRLFTKAIEQGNPHAAYARNALIREEMIFQRNNQDTENIDQTSQDNNSSRISSQHKLPSIVLLSQSNLDTSTSNAASMLRNDVEYDNYRRFILQLSLCSSTHDVYDPKDSSLSLPQRSDLNSNQQEWIGLSVNQQVSIKKNSKDTVELEFEESTDRTVKPKDDELTSYEIDALNTFMQRKRTYRIISNSDGVSQQIIPNDFHPSNYVIWENRNGNDVISTQKRSSKIPLIINQEQVNRETSSEERELVGSKSVHQVQKYILSKLKGQYDSSSQNMHLIESSTLRSLRSASSDHNENDHSKHTKKVAGGITSPQKKPGQSSSNKQLPKEVVGPGHIQTTNKKSLNDRNFTQINLASVFESLRLSNRLASLEGKQYHGQSVLNSPPEKPNDLMTPIQQIKLKSTHSRHNSSQKRIDPRAAVITGAPTQDSRLAPQNQQIPSSSLNNPPNHSPLGLTPRDFTKKSNPPQTANTATQKLENGGSPNRRDLVQQAASSSVENTRTATKIQQNHLLSTITVDLPLSNQIQSHQQQQQLSAALSKKKFSQPTNSRQTKIVSLQENSNATNTNKRTSASPPGPALLMQAKTLKIPKLNESKRGIQSPIQQGEETSALLSDRESKQRLEQQYSARLKTSVSPKQNQQQQLLPKQTPSTSKLIDSKRGSKSKVTSPNPADKSSKLPQSSQKKVPHSTYYRLPGSSTMTVAGAKEGSQSAMWGHHNSTPHIMQGVNQDLLSSSAIIQHLRPQDVSMTSNNKQEKYQIKIPQSEETQHQPQPHLQLHLQLPQQQQSMMQSPQQHQQLQLQQRQPAGNSTQQVPELSPRIIESVQTYQRQIVKKPTVSLQAQQQQQMSKLKQLQSRQKLSNPAISYEMNSTNNMQGEGSISGQSLLGSLPNNSKCSINSSALQRNSNSNCEHINSSLLNCLSQYNQEMLLLNKGNNSMMHLYPSQPNQLTQKSGALTDRDGMHGRIIENTKYPAATQRGKFQPSQSQQQQLQQTNGQQNSHFISEGLRDSRMLKTEANSQLLDDQTSNLSHMKYLIHPQHSSPQSVVFLPPNHYSQHQKQSQQHLPQQSSSQFIDQDQLLPLSQTKSNYASNNKATQVQQVYQVQQLINSQRQQQQQVPLQSNMQQPQQPPQQTSLQKSAIPMQTNQTEKSTSSTFETDRAFFSPNQLRSPATVNQFSSPTSTSSSSKPGITVKPRLRQPQEYKQAQLLQMQSHCEQLLSQSQSTNGFLSHRPQTTTTTMTANSNAQSRKKSNDPPSSSSAIKKGIQSSRGSYQGQYSDFKSLAVSSTTSKHITSAQPLLAQNCNPQLRSTHLSSQVITSPHQQPSSFAKLSNNYTSSLNINKQLQSPVYHQH